MSNTIRKVEVAAKKKHDTEYTSNSAHRLFPSSHPSLFCVPLHDPITWPSLSLCYSQHYSIHPSRSWHTSPPWHCDQFACLFSSMRLWHPNIGTELTGTGTGTAYIGISSCAPSTCTQTGRALPWNNSLARPKVPRNTALGQLRAQPHL
jgi:hypothetical protein